MRHYFFHPHEAFCLFMVAIVLGMVALHI